MPTFRCTNNQCRHTWFQRSAVDDQPDCEECGDPAQMVDDDDLLEEELVSEPEPAAAPRLGQARQLALQLLEKHSITKPFVDVFAIAAKEGFGVEVKLLPQGLSGQLVGTVIEVNTNEAEVRQRFTVAHELGHYSLQTVHGLSRGSAQVAIEREANAFAGELLVPGRMLRDQNTTDAASLRRVFKVSRQTLQIAAQHHRFALTGEI